MENDIGKTIARLLDAKNGGNQSDLARYLGVTPQAVQQWIAGETKPRRQKIAAMAEFFGVSAAQIEYGVCQPTDAELGKCKIKTFALESADASNKETGSIPYWDARASCGGGFLNYEEQPKGTLVKELKFFQRYRLKPGNAIAVYADGDSMCDFIVDGDIVIFDTSKTTPESGKIFLISHPDGLRIKQLFRSFDGSWILQSRNPNKQLFPDERIEPAHADQLRIYGRFVYRQGGE